MKIVKLSVFALTLGLFIASCGNNESTETPAEETTVEETVEMAPAAEEAPAVDSMAAAADTTATEAAAH
ncbi:MAG: hypothetical protein H6551_02885 [Chitinophagales bacterium]|nr:hypothetical protein [Chitinophagaceae bacterium]MCB9064069.1 hypothetical protein [Chitinophagales bacterium]